MHTITWDIAAPDGAERTYTIYPIGDIHLGAAACDEQALARVISKIKSDDYAYWIGMGDMTDGIGRNVGDKRSAEASLAKWLHGEPRIFERQRERLIETVKPIAGKCIGLLMGNHEESVLNRLGQDMYIAVASELSKEAGHDRNLALGYSAFIRLRIRRPATNRTTGGASSVPITIYAHHGYGGGRKAGGKALKLEDQVMKADADIYLFGHVHGDVSIRGERMYMSTGGKLQRRMYVATVTGTYLKTILDDGMSSYSESHGYNPTPIGSPEIAITARGWDPVPEIRMSW